MNKALFGAVIMTAQLSSMQLAFAQPAEPVKGTVCFANALRNTEQVPISCKGLGKFSSVAEIYERGYRVVSTGVLPEAGVGTVFIFIEERK